MNRRFLRILVLAAVLLAAIPAAWAAGINVDRLELVTHGGYSDTTGLFAMNSRLFFDMSFEGGDKFAGLLKLEFLSGSVESDLTQAGLTLAPTGTAATDIEAIIARLNAGVSPRLKTAAVTARHLFGIPLEATYFVGALDNIASGDDFPGLFGAAPFGTELRGPMVYPDGVGGDSSRYYDGLDSIYGTGLKIGLVGKKSAYYLYAYQDSDLGAGNWTANLRALFDTGSLKLELFGGGSYAPAYSYGLWRGGLLFNYAPGKVGEFFAQIGLTRWDPNKVLGMDDFYFLFEPRLNFYPGSLAITVFYHPTYYREKATNEKSALDLNVNLKLGNISRTGSQGGVTTLLSFRPLVPGADPLTIDISPYFSAIASGVEWNFKLDLRLFPFPANWLGLFRPYIGVKTSF
jgi:hypothetical protein